MLSLQGKRYLVTGAGGFIGSNLAWELSQLGATVVAADNYRSGRAENLTGFPGQVMRFDVTEGVPVEGRLDGIFHDGDITDPRHGDDAEVLSKNVGGFENVLALARQNGCRLVYASTAGLYGNGPTPMREDQPKNILTAYGKSKLMMDEIGSRAASDIPVVGLRYFNVFGPREAHKGRAASMIYHLSNQMRAGHRPRLFKYGEQRRDFIYVKDVVGANLCALNAPSGVYNVGTGVASTFNDVVDALKAALGLAVETDYFDMPYDPLTYQGNTLADTTRARELLGFTAEWGLFEAVADYVKWMKERE